MKVGPPTILGSIMEKSQNHLKAFQPCPLILSTYIREKIENWCEVASHIKPISLITLMNNVRQISLTIINLYQ